MSKRKKHKNRTESTAKEKRNQGVRLEGDPSKLERLPVSYQEITDYYAEYDRVNPYALRKETISRIEQLTERPLLCYVAKTHYIPPRLPVYIDDSDVRGFGDLIHPISKEKADILLVSNGGSPEAAERIVRLLRESFKDIRYILPANAYSAATLICFSGDEIAMDSLATLGPIDPQLDGIPVHTILRAFETVEERLRKEGPESLTAYMPLIAKYDLHIFEICRAAQKLTKELATDWLSKYMLKSPREDERIAQIVRHFTDFDIHKSHARSIDGKKARELGLKVNDLEDCEAGLLDLVRSLSNQYELWFDKTPFFKVYENAHGICWGRQATTVTIPVPPLPSGEIPQRVSPERQPSASH